MTASAPRLRFLTWEDIHQDTLRLAALLQAQGHAFRGLLAVTRGGLVPAALLAHALDIRCIETLGVSSYDGCVRGEAGLTGALPAPVGSTGEGWLVVDDLSDSGATARLVRRLLPACRIATLYAKPPGAPDVDLFALPMPADQWLVFPWEEAPSSATPAGEAPAACRT